LSYAWGGYGGAGTNGPLQTPTITFGLSVPLPLFYQQSGEIKQAEAAYDTSSLQQAKTTSEVVAEVSTAFSDFASAKRLVERMEGPRRDGGGLLQSAKGAFETTAILYEKGATTLTDYLDALRTYIAAKVEYIGDLTRYWSAIYALEAAVGTDLRP
jgi:cobalt-zinc-cadmium efflux system outer membrane protein